MRYLLFFLALSFTTLNAQTLTETYIELSVTDSLPTSVKQITYDFTPQGTEMNTDAVYEEDTDWEKVQKRVAEESEKLREKLTKELTKEGFKVAYISNDDDYTISTYEDEYSDGGVRITVTNEAELKRLVAYLRAHHKGNGFVNEWEYEPTTTTAKTVIEALFTKAHSQAESIASLSGRKLGKLISVSDPATASTGYSILDTIIAMAQEEMMKERKYRTVASKSKTMVFRFALLD